MQASDIQIINNLLPVSYFLDIRNLLTSQRFPWFYLDNLSYGPEAEVFNKQWQRNDPKIKDTYGFTHIARDQLDSDSLYFEFFKPMVYFLEEKLQERINNVYRIRAVMTCKDVTFGDYYNVPHVDIPQPHKTMVYYVNNSDGDTIIFKERWRGQNNYSAKTVETTVTPEENKAVIFDGLRYHTGSVPTINNRILININFD